MCLPTHAPTWHFADAVADAVGALVIVDALKTRLKAGYAAKTDRLVARRLADALRRESVTTVYYPPPAIRELRELCRYRQTLVRTRTALTQRLRAVLLRHGIGDGPARLYTRRGLAWCDTLALPPRAATSVAGLRALLEQTHERTVDIDQEVRTEAARDPIAQQLLPIPGESSIDVGCTAAGMLSPPAPLV